MANQLYDKYREGQLLQNTPVDWDLDDIRVQLVDLTDYTVDLALHEFLSSVPALGRVGASVSLTAKTGVGGVADAADVTIPTVTGDQSEIVLVYKHTGVDTTSKLIAYLDTATSGLPVSPNGGNIAITWDNGAFRIFKL